VSCPVEAILLTDAATGKPVPVDERPATGMFIQDRG
jgi:hypothetical protein